MNSPGNYRRGFTLMEILGLLPLMAAILALSVALTPIVVREVPAASRAIQTHSQMLGMLQRIQQDMDAGLALPDAPPESATQASEQDEHDGKTLLIQTSAGMVCYKFKEDEVTRTLRADSATPSPVWQMWNVVINWKRIEHAGLADAIEIHTAVKGYQAGQSSEHLANSYMFFLNTLHSQLVQK